MKRVLLLGGSGQLGTAILARWSGVEIVAPAHDELPLEDGARLAAALERHRPDLLLNAAAFHDVDRCERERRTALEINARAVGRAARFAAARGAVFLTMSTDYVFDGSKGAPYAEGDAPHPLSCYGASKLAGERLVAAAGGRALVVRTCGLYGAARSRRERTGLVERIAGRGADRAPLRVVADVIASPTFAGHLADALRRLIERGEYGVYHAAGAGAVSWYDFACEVRRQARAGPSIEPIAAAARPAAAVRPAYSALDNAKLREASIVMPPWRDGIEAYLAGEVR